jgi:hypothetical protein
VPRFGAIGLAIAYLTGFSSTAAALLIYVGTSKLHSRSVTYYEHLS